MKPLDGIRIIDLTRIFSGPFATQILADLGADVVKVEKLDGGDDARSYGVLTEDDLVGPAFLALNRNKRSIAVDATMNEGRAVLKRLISQADVVVDNFRPGVMVRLGLDYANIVKDNPRVISCSISGFGSRGPLRSRAANDLQMQAFSGLLNMTGDREGYPVRTPVAIADMGAGLFATIGILAALLQREKTGQGQQVETSMLAAILNLLNHFYTGFWLNGRLQPKMGTANALGMPNQAFRTSDGWVAISAANDGAFRRLCQVLGAPTLATERRFESLLSRYAHRGELVKILSDITSTLTSDALLSLLDRGGVSCSPVRSLDETASDKLLDDLDLIETMDIPGLSELKTIVLAVHLSRASTGVSSSPPRLGEHTVPILREAGFSHDEVRRLEQVGAITSSARWR